MGLEDLLGLVIVEVDESRRKSVVTPLSVTYPAQSIYHAVRLRVVAPTCFSFCCKFVGDRLRIL